MIVVVSDLHLSEGRHPDTRKLAPTEDFFFDGEFSRFLEGFDSGSPEPVHLIINGDLFDFLQVSITREEIERSDHLRGLSEQEKAYICKYGAKTDELSTIIKLEKIARGHPVFFDSLHNFIAKGNRLTIIIGNHDIELFWPGVQECFLRLVRVDELALNAANGGDLAANVRFSPWFYYDRDYRFYAEHGNQYEELNSFRHFLYPVLPRRRSEINLPVGSLFVRYLLNKVENINPFADNIKPNTKYIAWVLRNNPLNLPRLLKLLGQFVVALAKSFRRSGSLSKYSSLDAVKFQQETDRRMAELCRDYALRGDPDASNHPLRRIIGLHKRPINDSKSRFLWREFFAYLDVWLFLIGGLGGGLILILALFFGWSSVVIGAALVALIISITAGDIFFSIGSNMSKENILAVEEIYSYLNDSGNVVRYLTFGHTHDPEIAKIGDDGFYFNTGTWGVIFDDQEALLREKKQFAALILDEPGAEPKLMRWNDGLGALEILPLFDS